MLCLFVENSCGRQCRGWAFVPRKGGKVWCWDDHSAVEEESARVERLYLHLRGFWSVLIATWERAWWNEGGSSPPTAYRALVSSLVFLICGNCRLNEQVTPFQCLLPNSRGISIVLTAACGYLFLPKHEFGLGKEICVEQGCISLPPSTLPSLSSEIPAVEFILHFVILDHTYCPY